MDMVDLKELGKIHHIQMGQPVVKPYATILILTQGLYI